ncbi:MAG: PHP domain-containing protein [Alphaproteobacteria bacterium]|nr:PHP domain-containing protein [Alphaproteobacteria bacterium]
MQKFGLHTHTTFSDGRNTVEEMLRQAVLLGFDQIGISDHLMVHKNIKQTPSWDEIENCGGCASFHDAVDKCNKHAEDIRKTGKMLGISTFVGYEVDYFTYSGWEDEFRDFLKKIDYDYLISGNHFLTSQNGEDIFDIWRFDKTGIFAPEPVDVYLKRHFQTIEESVRSELFLFLAHLDYAQKAKSYVESEHGKALTSIISALKETKTGCEISTKGIRKFGHYYPSERILRELIASDVALIISDDAHATNELGFYFAETEEELTRLKCKNRLNIFKKINLF